MDNQIPEIEELIKQFSKLPGLGPKSAKRIILKLINNKENLVKPLAQSLSKVYKNVVRCINCGNLKVMNKICVCESEINLIKFVLWKILQICGL
jgi:Recombinational DNA repair protein (RecF pathway)